VAVTCAPAATVLWLGGRLLQQDRRLETQYRQDRREQAADRAVRSLQATLSEPALFQAAPGARAILIAYPGGPMLFRPESMALPEAPAELFREGEEIEYRGDPEKAAEAYRRLTSAREPATRAGAWLRLARTLRKGRHPTEALAAYGELARFENIAAAGWPARVCRCGSRFAMLARTAWCTGTAHRHRWPHGRRASAPPASFPTSGTQLEWRRYGLKTHRAALQSPISGL